MCARRPTDPRVRSPSTEVPTALASGPAPWGRARKHRDPPGRVYPCGRPARSAAGHHSPGGLPTTGHQLATAAVPPLLPTDHGPLRDGLRQTPGPVPSQAPDQRRRSGSWIAETTPRVWPASGARRPGCKTEYFRPLLLQGVPPLPFLLPEADPALRRVRGRAPPAPPPASADRVHLPQGLAGVLPPRPQAVRRGEPTRLPHDPGLLHRLRRPEDPERRGDRLRLGGGLRSVQSPPPRPVPRRGLRPRRGGSCTCLPSISRSSPSASARPWSPSSSGGNSSTSGSPEHAGLVALRLQRRRLRQRSPPPPPRRGSRWPSTSPGHRSRSRRCSSRRAARPCCTAQSTTRSSRRTHACSLPWSSWSSSCSTCRILGRD